MNQLDIGKHNSENLKKPVQTPGASNKRKSSDTYRETLDTLENDQDRSITSEMTQGRGRSLDAVYEIVKRIARANCLDMCIYIYIYIYVHIYIYMYGSAPGCVCAPIWCIKHI